MAITYSDFDTLSKGRKKYIEKRASKAGLSIDDYFKAQAKQAEEAAEQLRLKNLGFGSDDVNVDLDSFKPDWGTKTAKIKKTQYKMNIFTWVEAVMNHANTGMPHKKGEFTTMVPFENTEYMGTWQLTEQHRQQIGDAMRKGCMGFTIDYTVGPVEQCAFESIRVCKINKITPSKETYDVGGNFAVSTLTGMVSLKSVANSWCNVQKEAAQ